MEKAERKFKANPDFLLREVAGEAVLIPVGEAGVFENSVISLNDTCSFLWKLFQEPRTPGAAYGRGSDRRGEERVFRSGRRDGAGYQKVYRRVCKVWIIKGGVK